MLIMRQGEVMASSGERDLMSGYARKNRTRVSSVEICSTIGGYYELVVRWADKAIGMLWATDRNELRSWVAEQKWPKPVEYAVQAKPVLLDPPPAPPAQEPDIAQPSVEPDAAAGRVHRERTNRAAPPPAVPDRVRRVRPAREEAQTDGRVRRTRAIASSGISFTE